MKKVRGFRIWTVGASLLITGAAWGQSNACASAPALPLGVTNGSMSGATTDGSSACDDPGPDKWYRFTPVSNSVLYMDACGSSRRPTISVHTACPGNAANQLGCNYDDSYHCGYYPHLEVNVLAGQTYYVRIASPGNSFTLLAMNLPAKPPTQTGPDIVAGDIPEMLVYDSAGGYTPYALGSSACNIGTVAHTWTNQNNSNDHPVISTSMYRLKNGLLTQIGMAWIKHGWASGTETFCDYCPAGGVFPYLLPGCTDSYDVPQNGTQWILGPRSEINPTTGAFPYPPNNGQAIVDSTSRRIRCRTIDIDPAQNAGALYFTEVQYVGPEDAAANLALNNNSYRQINISSITQTPSFAGETQRTRPAIMAWADHDPAVTLASADYDEAGITCRFWVASKVVNNGNGTWTYLYNIQNLNSNRSGSSFVLPKGNFVDITNAGHSFIPAHSGDVYAGTPWNWSDAGSSLAWTCPQTFAQNPNASALRWGAMYTYWFTATTPPTTAAANIGLFMPGGTSSVAVLIPVPGAAPCAPDLNADGSVDFFDYDDFVSCFEGISCLPGLSADFNHDGSVDFFDYDDFVAAFEIGC